MKFTKNKKAFTLVELIVVIIIISILGTIAFIALQGYSSQARDSKRISDVQNIKTSLELFSINTGKYPDPTGGFQVTYSGAEVRTQGTFGDATFKNVEKLNEIPLDPLTQSQYTYSVLNNKKEYQLGAIKETDELGYSNYLISNSYALKNDAIAFIKGNYNGILTKVSTGSITYVLAIPSIINSEINNIDIIDLIQNKKIVYNGFKNLPGSYINTNFNLDGDVDVNFINTGSILIFAGNVDELKQESKQAEFVENLKLAYDSTDIISQSDINNILNIDTENDIDGTLLLSQILINNYINSKVNINYITSDENNDSEGSTESEENGMKVSLGRDYTCIITTLGDLKCWGANRSGQLGDGTTENKITPYQVLSGVSKVSSKDGQVCAVTTLGDLKCWGYNYHGQVGDGTTEDKLAPTQILSGISDVACGGNHTCAITNGGDLKCWGRNYHGQLGDGTGADKLTPTQISTGFSKISLGSAHTCAITNGGDLKCWGANNNGQLGDSTTSYKLSPVQILSGISDISCGGNHTCAVTNGGDLKCWGANNSGQLGDSTLIDKTSPLLISSGISKTALGSDHTCSITTSGDLKCWGANYSGQLGDSTEIDKLIPTQILTGISDVNLGGVHTCAVTTLGNLKCWGANESGQLGDGTTNNSSTPIDISGF